MPFSFLFAIARAFILKVFYHSVRGYHSSARAD
jgi:hypothetical protein